MQLHETIHYGSIKKIDYTKMKELQSQLATIYDLYRRLKNELTPTQAHSTLENVEQITRIAH
jgi:hypothetical protein